MIEIYRSRHTPGVKGSEISWRIGEKATLLGMRNPAENGTVVTVLSRFMSHPDAPSGRPVIEVQFPSELGKQAALADNLLPVDREVMN